MNNNINTSEIFNISKALIIGFFGFWFCNYLALIVGLISGIIDVMPSTECHIYVPTYTMVISAIGFLYCLKNRKLLNYKHFLVFFILLSLEIMFLLIYIPKLALPQIEKIHYFTMKFAPWEIIVRVG
jgi:hypothetical protein